MPRSLDTVLTKLAKNTEHSRDFAGLEAWTYPAVEFETATGLAGLAKTYQLPGGEQDPAKAHWQLLQKQEKAEVASGLLEVIKSHEGKVTSKTLARLSRKNLA